jgi:solute:Na+ symporter, SSS family
MRIHLAIADFTVIIAYFAVVLMIGYFLKGKMKTSADFLLSKRTFSHWVTGIAFMSANLGALEVMGHVANGAKYGMRTNHWYWVGAIPAMIFLGLFMVRFYYTNGIRSVPEYLRLRYDYRAHLLNSLSFAVVTVLMAGIDMFAFAIVFKSMLGWPFELSVLLAASVVLLFVFWGGLSSSIYNEFLQFFLIVLGFLPLTFLGLHAVGGWRNLLSMLPVSKIHTWQGMGAADDPLGVPWWVMVVGNGLCAAPAYWCTDFVLVQRAMAARDLTSACKTPLVAALPKMFFPGIVTVQGMLAIALAPNIVQGQFNLALPFLMSRFYGPGMLGFGITALLASFMSGMAGNITAFNTVLTYDIYQTYLVKHRGDRHYLTVGRLATIAGTLIACASSFLVLYFNNLMDYMALISILFISPFFVIFLLGMLWKRPSATAGFYGMLGGLGGAVTEYLLFRFGIVRFASPMAANIWTAVWGLVGGLTVMLLLSFLTKPPDRGSLHGLVYDWEALRILTSGVMPWYRTPAAYAAGVLVIFVVLNIAFF